MSPVFTEFDMGFSCQIALKVKVTKSCLTLRPHGLYSPWNSLGHNTGLGSLSLLQGIFPTQGSNPGLQHCRWILFQLSHQGSPRILEWVAYRCSSRSSWPRNRTRVSCIAGGLFTNWAIREAQYTSKDLKQGLICRQMNLHFKNRVYGDMVTG